MQYTSAVEKTPEVTANTKAPQYPIESVDNALKILLLLGERDELRLTEVAQYLGVASSTAHRMLAMLTYRGFIRQDPGSKTYLAGTALTGVAFAILQRFDVRTTLRPYLDKLNRALGETLHLGLLDGTSVRFIDAIESPQAVRVASRLGLSSPAYCTSTGKAMLAQLPADELHALYPDENLGEGLTANSIRTRDELERRLATVRQRGYATSAQESEKGVSSVGVAFPRQETPYRIALSVSVPSSRTSATHQRELGAELMATVREAGELLHR
jgi:DNA-binding IclR family transcriptional regulator